MLLSENGATHPMKTFRIVVGVLAILPLALVIDILFFHPELNCDDCIRTYIYMLLGIPILIFNYWAWFESEIIEFAFFGKKPEN